MNILIINPMLYMRVVELQSTYRNNCLNYRESISTKATAQGLISVAAGWSD